MTPYPITLFPASSLLACFSALFPQFLPLPYLRNAEIKSGSFFTRDNLIFACRDFREVVAMFVEHILATALFRAVGENAILIKGKKLTDYFRE